MVEVVLSIQAWEMPTYGTWWVVNMHYLVLGKAMQLQCNRYFPILPKPKIQSFSLGCRLRPLLTIWKKSSLEILENIEWLICYFIHRIVIVQKYICLDENVLLFSLGAFPGLEKSDCIIRKESNLRGTKCGTLWPFDKATNKGNKLLRVRAFWSSLYAYLHVIEMWTWNAWVSLIRMHPKSQLWCKFNTFFPRCIIIVWFPKCVI